MAAQPIVIKKYENRRLYDTANSRYVNLEDIAQLVRDGADVQVLDASTGEDLTRIVLTQIIVESAKERDSVFPLDLLRHMIIASGKASKNGMLNYMQMLAGMYQNAYRAFTPGLPGFNLFHAPADPKAPSVEDLQRRIEELERLVRDAGDNQKSSETKGPQPLKRRTGS